MILVAGSLNLDLVVRAPIPRPGETVLGGELARHPGGKGANQAVAAARAGGQVRLIGRVGHDDAGSEFRAALAGEGIDVAPVTATNAPTGTALVVVNPAGENTIVVSPGANLHLRPGDLAPGWFEDARVVVLQLELPLETVRRAAELGHAAGATVLLNAAPAWPLADELLRDVDVLVVNEHEAAALLHDVADGAEMADALARRVPLAVVTLGARGVAWAARGGGGRLPALPVTAVDTTAAGDAFVGALAVALGEDQALEGALRFASAAGALAVTRRGAGPSLPRRAEIDALAGGVLTPGGL
ncbi:ribokinase (plasmid) [Deinococcus aetherius]|uniref:Ribokinase n=1 Tax=Deinococcus aetherius TaxID=200252 RepID=A0ABM8AIL7_9DEIO|nr:ribokinase [Deinococcus aetherius]BDP43649.1 ribokinase [Deinococcus aetherius]